MRYTTGLILLLLLSSASAASSIDKLLGVIPGEISTIEGNNVGGPFEIYRIPTPTTDLSVIFVDLEVMILLQGKKVIGVSSKRAFNSKIECENAQNIVRNLLSMYFPSKYTGRDSRWQYQTEDKSITAGALCSSASPYPVLRLDVTHTRINDELLQHFTKVR